MRTTVAIDDDLLTKAQAYTGLHEKSALIREALKALISVKAPAGWPASAARSRISACAATAPRAEMILVDSLVWIDHLHQGDHVLAELLDTKNVVMHPFIVGELALGSLHARELVLDMLQDLPQLNKATEEEVLHFIERQHLFGMGIGYVDAHLLAAVLLTPGTTLWTRDKRLAAVADQLGIAARPVQ